MSSSMSVLCAAAVRVTAGLGTKTLAFLLASGRWIVSQSKTFISDSHVRLPAWKTWHLWTGILGGLSLLFSVLAFWTSLDSSRYARWTAHKDFALLCMDDSTRHLSVDCPKFANYSLPAPPATVKTRAAVVDSPPAAGVAVENQTDIIIGPEPLPWHKFPLLPDVWETTGCTSWTLQPALFRSVATPWWGLLEQPRDFHFELACASTSPAPRNYLLGSGDDTTSSSTTTTTRKQAEEEPYACRTKCRLHVLFCRIHTLFWVVPMSPVAVFMPSLVPEGKRVGLLRVRKVQAVMLVLLLFLHSWLCPLDGGGGSMEDHVRARLTALLARYGDEGAILGQILRAMFLTALLPGLWQLSVSFPWRQRGRAKDQDCRLSCRVRTALVRFNDDLVPYSRWSNYPSLPMTDAEIYVRRVLYVSLFPALGLVLTWPIRELMLDRPWSPVPLLLLVLLYTRDSADNLEEWEESQRFRDSGREKRLADASSSSGGDDDHAIGGCERCETDELAIARWV